MARTPGYRLHKPSGLAFIEIRGKRHYLGPHGTADSRRKYTKLLTEYLSVGDAIEPIVKSQFTVNQLVAAFLDFADKRYQKNDEPTTEVRAYETVAAVVAELYGDEPAAEFGPLKFIACRQRFIDKGTCRSWVNSYAGRLRRIWKWGVSREFVDERVWSALRAVEGVRKGECVESEPVKPVSLVHVEAIKDRVSPVLWALIQFQLLTGCRPGEACRIRPGDIRRHGKVWEYIPGSHKTEHHGKSRVIFIGPRAQRILKPFLERDPVKAIFSPRESREWFLGRRRKRDASKRRKKNPKRQPGEQYKVATLGHSIRQACIKAGIPPWHPNQLRHTAGTLIRKKHGVENTRVILGHSKIDTTEIYAERDFETARKIAQNLG